jgi:hypothetical protein
VFVFQEIPQQKQKYKKLTSYAEIKFKGKEVLYLFVQV